MAIAEIATSLATSSVQFQRAAERVRALMVARTVRAFSDQHRAGIAWPARNVPNIAGIITDLERSGRMPPGRRFQPRPTAIDTGTLRASIAACSYVKGNVVTYGSAMPYASKVQRGGLSVLPITPTVRKNLGKLLKRKPELRARLGFLFSMKVYEVRTPPRPFVALTADDRAAIDKILKREFAGTLDTITTATASGGPT